MALPTNIHNKTKNYYAYYFFEDALANIKSSTLKSMVITLYNEYKQNSDQVDPKNCRFKCYAHNYETYNDIKNVNVDNMNLYQLTTFTAPNVSNGSSITFTIQSQNEINTIKTLLNNKTFKGLMFVIETEDKFTVHGVQCSVRVNHGTESSTPAPNPTPDPQPQPQPNKPLSLDVDMEDHYPYPSGLPESGRYVKITINARSNVGTKPTLEIWTTNEGDTKLIKTFSASETLEVVYDIKSDYSGRWRFIYSDGRNTIDESHMLY